MSKIVYEVQELRPSPQIYAEQRYRKYLYYAAHTATRTSDVYFLIRLGLILTATQQTWRMWLMIMVEWIFARRSTREGECSVLIQ
jgi:hypothetical protein